MHAKVLDRDGKRDKIEADNMSQKTISKKTLRKSKPHTYTHAKPAHKALAATTAAMKGKAVSTYGVKKSSGLKLHDAGVGAAWSYGGAGPAVAAMPDESEEEGRLAERLVDELADTSGDVNALCDTYQLKREELGRLTGFSLRALAEWAAGKLPSQPARRRLQEVRRLLDALGRIVNLQKIPKWLHQPNAAFERLTPLQVIELGEIDRLWAMIYDIQSGQPE